jgi:hypothetical protein
LLKDNKVVLMGWITKDEFQILKTVRRKGEILHTMKVDKDFYEVPVERLTPLISLVM